MANGFTDRLGTDITWVAFVLPGRYSDEYY